MKQYQVADEFECCTEDIGWVVFIWESSRIHTVMAVESLRHSWWNYLTDVLNQQVLLDVLSEARRIRQQIAELNQ